MSANYVSPYIRMKGTTLHILKGNATSLTLAVVRLWRVEDSLLSIVH